MRPFPLFAALALGVTGTLPDSLQPEARITVIPELNSLTPGEVFRVAVQIEIPNGYHISWTNPGQTGLPSTLGWEALPGVAIDNAQWPFPERDVTAGRVSHVYRRTVVAFTRFTVDSSIQARTVRLHGELGVGICGATCRPQRERFDVSLRVRARAAETTSAWRRVVPSLENLPAPSTGLAVRGATVGAGVRLSITGADLRMPSADSAIFFPDSDGVAVVVALVPSAGEVTITLPVSTLLGRSRRLLGVLVGGGPWLIGSPSRALAIDAMVRDPAREILQGGRGTVVWKALDVRD